MSRWPTSLGLPYTDGAIPLANPGRTRHPLGDARGQSAQPVSTATAKRAHVALRPPGHSLLHSGAGGPGALALDRLPASSRRASRLASQSSVAVGGSLTAATRIWICRTADVSEPPSAVPPSSLAKKVTLASPGRCGRVKKLMLPSCVMFTPKTGQSLRDALSAATTAATTKETFWALSGQSSPRGPSCLMSGPLRIDVTKPGMVCATSPCVSRTVSTPETLNDGASLTCRMRIVKEPDTPPATRWARSK